MATEYYSEIRNSEIRELLGKVKSQKLGQYLRKMRLAKVRAFTDQDVDFDFPVTALIGTNGGGKSTVLGAAALAYKAVKPATFFPKSSMGDQSMENWSIGYDLIEKKVDNERPIQRGSRFKQSKWARDDLIDRPVLYFGIQRTVPAGERKEFKRIASAGYVFEGTRTELEKTIGDQVARILGKDVSHFVEAKISDSQTFYIGGNGTVTYSEFHFGAGESSVIRMVREIESAPQNALVLVEEIENGLHPVAVRKMVEYLIDASKRRSIQSIFTTHSEDALAPLPPEAIWSSIDGKVRQGKISIDGLRAISGRIDRSVAVFAEDSFAKNWVESILRRKLPENLEHFAVYAVLGDSLAANIHKGHRQNPAVNEKLKSVCVLDGDSDINEDTLNGIIKLPGKKPESEVFDYVAINLEALAMRLTVALHLGPEKEQEVKSAIEHVSRDNRDPHLLFNQVGQRVGFVSESIVMSAFISLWIDGNPEQAERIAKFIDEARPQSDGSQKD